MGQGEHTHSGHARDASATDDCYRQIVELSPDAIFVHDRGVLLYANPAAATLFGMPSADDLLGRSAEDLVAPSSRETVRTLLRQVEGKKPGRRVLVDGITLATGHVVHAELSSAPLLWCGRPARQVVVVDVTEQRRAESHLLETQQQLRTLVDHAPEAIVVYDTDSLTFVDLNANAEKLFGLTREELLRTGPIQISPPRQPDGRPSAEAGPHKIQQALDGKAPVFEWCHRHSSGGEVLCEVRLVRLPSTSHRLVRGSIIDISERKRVEQELRASEERFSKAFHASPVGITISRIHGGRFLNANRAFLDMTGYTHGEVVGHKADELNLWVDAATRRAISGAIHNQDPHLTAEGRLRTKSGEILHILASFVRIEVGGEDCLLTIGSDISERKAFEEQLRHLAFHDPLTGLPNRALFEDRLSQALMRARKENASLAVLFLDLDRFKVVNDTLGHTAGDGLLADVGNRIRSNLAEEHTLARFGGDEFAVLLEQVEGRSEVERTVERLITGLEAPFEIMGTRVDVTVSVGVAFSRGNGEEPEDLLRFMDIAMYRAKQEEGSVYRIFDRHRDSPATRRLHMENALRQALEQDELEVHYQPIVSLDRGGLRGMEALIRWRHPTRGLVSPPEFVPMAEELGLIVPIGEWVLRQACRRAAAWRARLPADMPLSLSVNLSARQLQTPELVPTVEAILGETGLPAAALELELTENVAVQATEQLRRLRSIGVRLALDDFGTGYASLSYLRQLEVDTLKVDQSFIHGMEHPGGDDTLVRTILFLADQLGLAVVAEGVETKGQAERLRSMGCRMAQGFFFARPLPEQELEAILGETLPVPRAVQEAPTDLEPRGDLVPDRRAP